MKNKKSSHVSGTRYYNGMAAVFIICLITACASEFDLQLEKNEPKLVVEGWISSLPGPYEVRLTETVLTRFNRSIYDYAEQSPVPVKDALVIISDNTGIVDTLRPRLSKIINIYENDTVFQTGESLDGLYGTIKTRGVPGRTYHLYVKVQGKEYTASAYMPPVPPIESVGLTAKRNPFKSHETHTVPTVTFHEPKDSENYYLIGLGIKYEPWDPTRNRHSPSWAGSVLSDQLLPPYVQNFPVDDGVTSNGRDWYFIGEEFSINMASLTKETYEYFKALFAQFRNDGGAYQAAPASPPTNISNGGLGFFWASAVTEKTGKVE